MKKHGYRLINAVLVLTMVFSLFTNSASIAHADGVFLYATGLDDNSLLDGDIEPTDPWTRCVNLGTIVNGTSADERAKVIVSGDTGYVKLELGDSWTYGSSGLYEKDKQSGTLFELIYSSPTAGVLSIESGVKTDYFYIVPKTGISAGRYRQAIILTHSTKSDDFSSGTSFTLYADITVVDSDTGVFASPVTYVKTTFQSKDYVIRLLNTLEGLANATTTGFTVEYGPENNISNCTDFNIDVDGDKTEDVFVRFYVEYDKNDNNKIDDISVAISRHSNCTVAQSSYNLDTTGASGTNLFGSLSFTFYDMVTWFDGINDGSEGGFPVNGELHQSIVPTRVKHGQALNTAISAFPDVIKAESKVEKWVYYPWSGSENNAKQFALDTIITEDINAQPVWASDHTHTYHSSTNEEVEGQVEWVWDGDAVNGYSAELKLYCTGSYCPHEDHGRLIIPASVKKTMLTDTCTMGNRVRWTATATYGDNTYTSTKDSPSISNPTGHNWKFETAEDKVVWTGNDQDGYTAASIVKTCQNEKHDTSVDGRKQIEVKASVSVSTSDAKCGEYNKTIYTAVFDSSVDPDIKEPLTFTKEVKGEIVPHKWKVKYVSSNGDFTVAPTVAQLHLECENDENHSEIVEVSGKDSITLVSEEKGSKTYKYVGKTSDGQQVEATEKIVDHNEHGWTVEFDWNYNKTDREVKSVSAVAICSVGKEQKALKVNLTSKEISGTKQYTATAEDPSGKEWTSTKYIDKKTGELTDGVPAIALENSSIKIYGLEETYPYTNTAIKPKFTVMDGDRVLAQGVDYTVSYKNNKKMGVATVTVKGTGNYTGKSATAHFTIVDPKQGFDVNELSADKIKKIEITEKSFEYSGKPQYPSQVTVTLKDNTIIEYTVDEEGNYSTTSEKKVVLSFCNNVNKGTATLDVTGGKYSKRKTYKITAADISNAEFKIGETTWAVKAETPKITAIFKGMELVAGQDFSAKFKAQKVGDATGTATISGKGNFKKKTSLTYKVNPLELTEKNILVNAVAGVKVKKVKVSVVDNAGNAINKKMYTVEIQDANGNGLDKKDIIPEKIRVVIKATAKASGCITTGNDGVVVNLEVVASDIAKVKGAFKVNKKYTKTYTGEAIELDEDDFGPGKIELAGLEYGKDFKIISYKDNVKKGTMTVTIQGIGKYSGAKTFKVKIAARPLDKEAPEN